MPIWSYEARSGDGELITGRVQAAGREVVLADLRGRGLSPVRVDQTRAPLFQQRVGTTALSSMFRGLSDLVASGVPLLRSLQLLAKGRAHQNLSTVLIDIADQVADGTAMAASMTFIRRWSVLVSRGAFLQKCWLILQTCLSGKPRSARE